MPYKTIKMRRDTAVRWMRINPLLADGELGFEIDTGRFKVGNGSLLWDELDYFAPVDEDVVDPDAALLMDHINSETPHPVYDDGPSLFLLYENAKV